jgi:hypothetical protein
MALRSLGPSPGRKLVYGVVLPATVVAALLGVALVAPSAGFLALMAATVGGAVLYMTISKDMPMDDYANRHDFAERGGPGGQSTDPTDEENPETDRLTGTLRLVGAGLGAAGILGLVAFALLV